VQYPKCNCHKEAKRTAFQSRWQQLAFPLLNSPPPVPIHLKLFSSSILFCTEQHFYSALNRRVGGEKLITFYLLASPNCNGDISFTRNPTLALMRIKPPDQGCSSSSKQGWSRNRLAKVGSGSWCRSTHCFTAV